MDPEKKNVLDIYTNSKIVGKHKGYTNYTIGQRKGIGLSYPDPRYVKSIDSKKNTITISRKENLYNKECYVSNINWLIENYKFPMEINCQIRYNGFLSKAILSKEDNKIHYCIVRNIES